MSVFRFTVWVSKCLCFQRNSARTSAVQIQFWEETPGPGYRWPSSNQTVQSDGNAAKPTVSAFCVENLVGNVLRACIQVPISNGSTSWRQSPNKSVLEVCGFKTYKTMLPSKRIFCGRFDGFKFMRSKFPSNRLRQQLDPVRQTEFWLGSLVVSSSRDRFPDRWISVREMNDRW